MKRYFTIIILLALFSSCSEDVETIEEALPSIDNVIVSQIDTYYDDNGGMGFNLSIENNNNVKIDTAFINIVTPMFNSNVKFYDVEAGETQLKRMYYNRVQSNIYLELVDVAFSN